MSFSTGAILDLVILLLLGVTIFYAARLSFFMKSFRDGRQGLQKLIDDLSKSIEQAQHSIEGMHNAAAHSGEELQEVIRESKFLSDELQFMNQSGDALAGRLEKLAERNRELIDLLESSGGIGVSEPYLGNVPEHSVPFREEDIQEEESSEDFFKIQDREFDTPEIKPESGFKSEAEKDFYEALQKKKQVKNRAGGVS